MGLKCPGTNTLFLWLFPTVLTAEQSTIGNSQRTNDWNSDYSFLVNSTTILFV